LLSGKKYSEKFGHKIASSDFSNETFKNYKWQNLQYAFQQSLKNNEIWNDHES